MTTALAQPVTRAAIEDVKIAALAGGVRIGDELLAEVGGVERLTVHEYATTGGITLELPHGVLVNAPFDSPFCADSDLVLERAADGLQLALDEAIVPVVSVVPLPGYLGATDRQGARVDEVVMSHADRIRVSPIAGCAYDCRFCDLAPVAYRMHDVERILPAIDVALKDTALPARHLLISGGSPPVKHAGGQDYFENVCVTVASHLEAIRAPDGSAFDVEVMMSARPDGPEFVDRMITAGVTGFSFNLEVFADTAARSHMPLKHKWARPLLGDMIARAVDRLGGGNGRVRSLIIPGLEGIDETLAGVEWLAEMGCSPVLSPFRPAPDTALVDAEPVAPEALRAVLDASRAIARRHQVVLGPCCVPCQHNTLTFPWDLA